MNNRDQLWYRAHRRGIPEAELIGARLYGLYQALQKESVCSPELEALLRTLEGLFDLDDWQLIHQATQGFPLLSRCIRERLPKESL